MLRQLDALPGIFPGGLLHEELVYAYIGKLVDFLLKEEGQIDE